MPKWFRLAVGFSCPALGLVSAYAKPGRGFVVGSILMLLSLTVGVSAFIIGRHDRQVSRADDPTTLNLHG